MLVPSSHCLQLNRLRMRKSFTTPLLVGGFLLATAAQAQVHVRFGPQVGLTLATTHFTNAEYRTSYRPGIAAGVRATIGYGHVALQPAVLFSQQGYQQHTDSGGGVRGEETHRLNYLCFPLNVAYTQHASRGYKSLRDRTSGCC